MIKYTDIGFTKDVYWHYNQMPQSGKYLQEILSIKDQPSGHGGMCKGLLDAHNISVRFGGRYKNKKNQDIETYPGMKLGN